MVEAREFFVSEWGVPCAGHTLGVPNPEIKHGFIRDLPPSEDISQQRLWLRREASAETQLVEQAYHSGV